MAADFWRGHLQVWLDGTPLLPGDTTGSGAVVVPLVDPSGEPRGSVGAWGSIPSDLGTTRLVAGITVAVLALAIALVTGAFVGPGRSRRAFTLAALLGVAGGMMSVLGAVRAVTRAATDDGLLRARRVVEVVSVSGRLRPAALERLTPGFLVTPLQGGTALRDSVVARDAEGAWVVATARGQSLRLRDDESPARRRALRVRFAGLALLVLLGALGAAASPPVADYLTASRHPRASE